MQSSYVQCRMSGGTTASIELRESKNFASAWSLKEETCIKQGFICWGGLADEARRERALVLRGGLQPGIEQLAKQDFMGIIFRLSKLLDELSLQYCEVSSEYCTVFTCRSTHTHRWKERLRHREREWGKCHLSEIFSFWPFPHWTHILLSWTTKRKSSHSFVHPQTSSSTFWKPSNLRTNT